jgi:hypothetical protein
MASLPPTTADRPRTTPPRLRAPLMGRAQELSLLGDALSDTLTSRTPHTVTLMGGPGVGKSRLCREFLADARVRHAELRVLSAQAREGGDPFGVVRGLLRARLNISEGEGSAATEQALRKTISEVMGDQRVGELVHFLGAFLDLNMNGSALAQAMSSDPLQLRQVGRTVLRHFFEADAAKQPLVIVLEDFHLAHADAANLVHYLVQAMSGVPILFVIVARPELLSHHPEWLDLSGQAIRFDLSPLQPDDAAEMVEQLLSAAGELPAELVDEAVELASGNPYLIEQIARAFVEQGVVVPRADRPWEVDLSKLGRVHLPLNVDDAIQAHVGALSPEEKNVLEMAAALGGVFWLGVLLSLERSAGPAPRLWSDPDADRKRLSALLDELIERDYLLRLPDSSVPGDVEYAFKHNLEREALHLYTGRNLLVRYHQVIAQWLELHLTDSSEEHHDLLAQHYEKAGVSGRAAQHYLLAAERARIRYAAARAAQYYGRGLALLGEGEGMLRINSLERWGETLMLSGEHDAALQAFESMRTLAFHLDLGVVAAHAHAHLGRVQRELGHLPLALEHLDAAHALYEHAGDRFGAAGVMELMATIHAARGNFAAAEHMIRDAVATLEPSDRRAQLAAALRTYAELSGRLPGRVDPSALLERSMKIFEELGKEVELARTALAYADQLHPAGAQLAVMTRDRADRIERAEQLRKRARELLDRHKGITIRANLGSAKV